MTATTPDLGKLERDARQAADALAAAKDAQAAAAKVAAAEREARSVEWAFDTIARYPQRSAEASDKVTAALAAFSAAALGDLPAARAAYLDIAARMADANALGEELARARGILRQAGILPPGRPNRPEPTGAAAPFPFIGGPPALPPFLDLLSSELEAARAAAVRVRPTTEDPGSFEGQASEAMKRAALAGEYRNDEELALLAALQMQAPDRWAGIPAEQKAATVAWLACREAAGHGDDPLPKVAAERLRAVEPPAFAPDDSARFTLYGQEGLAPRR